MKWKHFLQEVNSHLTCFASVMNEDVKGIRILYFIAGRISKFSLLMLERIENIGVVVRKFSCTLKCRMTLECNFQFVFS